MAVANKVRSGSGRCTNASVDKLKLGRERNTHLFGDEKVVDDVVWFGERKKERGSKQMRGLSNTVDVDGILSTRNETVGVCPKDRTDYLSGSSPLLYDLRVRVLPRKHHLFARPYQTQSSD